MAVFRNARLPGRVITRSLKFSVRNVTRGTQLGEAIQRAATPSARRTGLLKHAALAPGEGIWIVPCEAVHTFFMKFPIDVIYLNRNKTVRKLVPNMAPWRMSCCIPAHSVLELAANEISRTLTTVGDKLEFETA